MFVAADVCVRALKCVQVCVRACVCVRNYVKTTIGTAFAYCLVWRRMLVVVVVVGGSLFKLEIKTNGKFN